MPNINIMAWQYIINSCKDAELILKKYLNTMLMKTINIIISKRTMRILQIFSIKLSIILSKFDIFRFDTMYLFYL